MSVQAPSAEPPKFKAPTTDAWRSLAADVTADVEQQNATKAARDSLKEALITSLQMQHVIVLAGAGTSMAVGGPSMKELWDAAIGTKPTPAAVSTAKSIHYNFSPQNNIEAFLSNAEAYLQISADDAAVKEFVDSCKKVILAKCSRFLDVNKLDAHKIFLHRLSRRRVRDPRLKIFTTNYDLCFEQAASTLGGVVIDGFSFTPPRHYDPRYFSYDIIRRPRVGEDQGNYLEGVFHLYKLHGSVNWARSAIGVIHEKTDPSPDETCLIYPARGKYQQSFLQPHLESMSQYLAALREPNSCVIVTGFGFNDDHLSEPLLAAVRTNPHLRLIITGPGVAAMEIDKARLNRYWDEFFTLNKDGEDVWLINASFEEFAKLIPDLKSLTPADKLMKTIQGITGSK
jgi:NAD-dependent SIR2 family protein deacetylase